MGYESMDGGAPPRRRWVLAGFTLLAEVLGLATVVTVGAWMAAYGGGYSWEKHKFSWHPLLMTTGFVYLYMNAVLVYRVLPCVSKRVAKALHAVLLLLGGVCVVMALYVVLSVPGNKLYSLHGWLGISASVLFALQWAVALGSFVCGFTRQAALYKPCHVFFGLVIVCVAGSALVTGAAEFVRMNDGDGYTDYSSQGLLGNAFGVMVVATIVTVVYIVTNKDFARPAEVAEPECIPIN